MTRKRMELGEGWVKEPMILDKKWKNKLYRRILAVCSIRTRASRSTGGFHQNGEIQAWPK